MENTRDFFKKIREREYLVQILGTIKNRNCMNLMEAEDIKKGWQEYTGELYQKIFMTQIVRMV